MANDEKDKSGKAKYWVGILYLENMIADWQNVIAEKLQLPYAYCVHDKDVDEAGEPRKAHVHIMIVFRNTTTYKHAMDTFMELSATDKKAINTCQKVRGVRYMYEYLIHNTDMAKKANKHLYNVNERVIGNNFDIGAYEQISLEDEEEILNVICEIIETHEITNFFDLDRYVRSIEDTEYRRVFRKNQSYFNNIVKGFYHKKITERRSL